MYGYADGETATREPNLNPREIEHYGRLSDVLLLAGSARAFSTRPWCSVVSAPYICCCCCCGPSSAHTAVAGAGACAASASHQLLWSAHSELLREGS